MRTNENFVESSENIARSTHIVALHIKLRPILRKVGKARHVLDGSWRHDVSPSIGLVLNRRSKFRRWGGSSAAARGWRRGIARANEEGLAALD